LYQIDELTFKQSYYFFHQSVLLTVVQNSI
jgi:hypothetical protein